MHLRFRGVALAHCTVALALALAVAPRGHAATITEVQSNRCNIRLAGQIAPGDLQRLRQVLKSAKPRMAQQVAESGSADTFERTDICLDSPGGDFNETLAMVKFLVGKPSVDWNSIGTVVEKGAQCLAECAFIFMTGRYHSFHTLSFPLRQVEIGGALGFRTSTKAATTGAADEKALAAAFADAVRQIKTIIQQNVNAESGILERNKPFPRALTAEVLALEPGETLLLETVEQAGKWNIVLLGLPEPKTVSEAMLHRACINDGRWGLGGTTTSKATPSNAPVSVSNRIHMAAFKGFGPKGDMYCVAFYYKGNRTSAIDVSTTKSLQASKNEYVSTPESIREHYDTGGGQDSRYVGMGTPAWAMYPPSTKITDLPELLGK